MILILLQSFTRKIALKRRLHPYNVLWASIHQQKGPMKHAKSYGLVGGLGAHGWAFREL